MPKKAGTKSGKNASSSAKTPNSEDYMQKKFLNSVFNAITDGISVIDSKCNILYINQSLTHFYGYETYNELIGKKCYNIFRHEKRRCKDCPAMVVFETGKPEHIFTQSEDAHGDEVFSEIYFYPITDNNGDVKEVVEYTRNITRERLLEKQIEESEHKLSEILSVNRDVIVEYNAKLELLYVSENVKDFLGYTAEELLENKDFLDLVTPESKKKMINLYKMRMAGKSIPLLNEYEVVHKNGNVFPIETTVSLRKKNGKIIGGVASLRDITERKKTKDALAESEKLYRTLVETSPDGIVMTDMDTNIIMVNQSSYEMLGFKKPEEVLGKSAFDLMAPEDRHRILENIEEIVDTGRVKNTEFNFLHKNGSRIPIEFNASLIYDEKGEPTAFMGVSRNVSLRKKAEAEIKESREKFSNLFQKSNDAIIIHDLKGNIIDMNQKGIDLFGYSKKKIIKLHISDLHPKSELEKSKKAFKTISKKGFVKFEIEFKKKNNDIFPAEVSSSMFEIGDSKVIQGIIRDVTERKSAEEKLRESEELYRSVVETSPEAITITDLDGKITYVSKQTLKIHGARSEKDLIGKNAFDLITKEDQPRALKNLEKTLKKGMVKNLVYNLLRKDGSQFIGEMNAALVKDAQGKPKAFIATTRDITERKKAEEALHYRLAFEEIITTFSTHFINVRTDEIEEAINIALREMGQFAKVDRCFVFLLLDNQKKMNNTYEWCAEGINSKQELFHDINVNKLKWSVNRLKKLFALDIANVNTLPKEAASDKKILKKAGIKSVLAVPIVIGGKLYGFLGFDSVEKKRTWTDDTISILHVVAQIFANALERKRVEETAKESEEKFKSLAEKSPNMIFINVDGEVVYANEACEEIMGYKRKEVYSPDFNFMTLIAPESIDIIKKNFAKHKKGQEVAPYEYTLLKKDGSRMESIIATKLISYEGESAILGIITDISKRKEAEEEIKELKDFSESIVDTMAEGIMILDEDGFVTFMNPKIKEILGYDESQLVGKHWESIMASDYHRRMRDCYSENLNGNQDRFEAVLLKKNQTELPVLISASPQLKDDVFSGILVVITNITDQKKEHFAREELMKYKIKRGSTYLIEEKHLDRAKDVVYELYQNRFDGIIITREHPEKIKSEINLNLLVFWMTNDPKDKASVKPQFSLLEKIIDDEIDRNTFVFLDRFDYIVTQNNFKEALNFVQHLNELFYTRKAILLISLDPDTLTTQELSLLEKETSVIEKKQEERLSADLLDLLEFVAKFNRVGESPSYKQVGDEFKISRTTARKRIRDLVDLGLLAERKSGRFKFLILTDKGKESI